MYVDLSTYAKTRMAQRSFAMLFDGGSITVYAGEQPESPDMPPVGVAIATVTANDGLRFVPYAEGVMKDPAQQWVMQGLPDAVAPDNIAGWFRLTGPNPDPGYLDTSTYPRLDGPCSSLGTPEPGLVLPNLLVTPATSRSINGFYFQL